MRSDLEACLILFSMHSSLFLVVFLGFSVAIFLNSFTPKYFYFGECHAQILHTRLRTKCSSLNHDIFLKNLTDSPLCRCGSIENAEHYLLQCILYRQQRIEMLNSVSQLCHVTLDVLLSGDSSLSIDTNNKIFLSVHKFIKDLKRF